MITGKSWVNNHAHVLRPTPAVIPGYLNYSLMFYPFTPLTTGSTGRRKLTQKALMAAPYPLPPLQEQVRIVTQVEKLISTVDNVLSICDLGKKRAAVLRKSVLDIAFCGKLVFQDPNDEPASVLLARIRAERARVQEQQQNTRKATNGASPKNGQRRRRVKELAQGVSPGKG
jgi:type I restriction enzyme S subunit